MAYYDKIMKAAEMTAHLRGIVEGVYSQSLFANYFPMQDTDENIVRWVITDTPISQAAPRTAFNTAAPLDRDFESGEERYQALPKIQIAHAMAEQSGRPFGEGELTRENFERALDKLGAEIANRLILDAGEVLETGKIDISESSYKKQIVDFGRASNRTVALPAAAKRWSAITATVIEDLQAWQKITGGNIVSISTKVLTGLTKNTDLIKRHYGRGTDLPTVISKEAVVATIQAEGFIISERPVLQQFLTYGDDATATPQLSEHKVILLPAVGNPLLGNGLGYVASGVTSTAIDAKFGISEKPGATAYAFYSENPHQYQIVTEAVAMPVHPGANAVLVATVSAD